MDGTKTSAKIFADIGLDLRIQLPLLSQRCEVPELGRTLLSYAFAATAAVLAALGSLALRGVAASEAVGGGTVLHSAVGWGTAECVVVGPAVFRLIVLREDLLLAL